LVADGERPVGEMRFTIIAVGRPRAKNLVDAIAEYESRAARYWPLEIREVKAGTGRAPASSVRTEEGERLLRAAGTAWLVALDGGGVSMTSVRFAEWMRARQDAALDVAFVIGGAHGLDARVLQRARLRLAIAPWTLSHELARLVLGEQLYRAGTIVRGEPYHK
jgi:23S rRNA (pseudouridine1915-N3)-methyltransferase